MSRALSAEGTRAFSVWTNTTVELELMQRDIASWPILKEIRRSNSRGFLNY
jgi:hypothetical protein